MSETNKIKCCIKISDEALDDILSYAFLRATYWLYSQNIKEHKRAFNYTLLVPVTEDDSEFKKYHLTKNILLSGLKQYIEEYGITIDKDGDIDVSSIDSFDCELILQYALFGEQVFG